MDYCDVQKYLDSVGRMGSVPGLTAIKALLLELKNPELTVKISAARIFQKLLRK